MTLLRTTRLILRPYRDSDLAQLHALWTSPGVRRYLFDGEIIPEQFVRDEIVSVSANFAACGWGQWAALPHEDGPVIGFTGFRHFHEPPELELLFGLDEAYWGRGLAVEMATAAIDYGFRGPGFPRIQASTDVPNRASVRVMEKLGMTLLRRKISGGLDTVYYEISKETWSGRTTAQGR